MKDIQHQRIRTRRWLYNFEIFPLRLDMSYGNIMSISNSFAAENIIKHNRNLSLDILKIVMSFSVVLLHCHFMKDISITLYFSTVEGLFRLAVPTFLIINGYYFYNITSNKLFREWALRLSSLYLIWMIIYLPFWLDLDNILKTIIYVVNGYYVLWYIIGSIFSGIMVYYLRNMPSMAFLISAVVLYFFGCSIQMAGNIHLSSIHLDKLLNFNPVHRNFLLFCFPFFTIGFLIRKHKIDEKCHIRPSMIFLSLSIVVVEANFNRFFISPTENLDQIFSLMIASPMLFLYFKEKSIPGRSKALSDLSTSVYFLHPAILMGLIRFFPRSETMFSVIVLSLSITLGSMLVLLNKRIKFLL